MRILGHIHTFNDEDVIDESLRALLDQTYPLAEIVIVDNASTDGTLDRTFPEKVTVIRHPENRGTNGSVITGHGRGQESEADQIGLDYMVKAGFDPREAPGTFELLYKEYGDPPPLKQFFYGNHPTNLARFKRLTGLVKTKYATQVATQRLVTNTEEFKQRTREVVVATGVLDYEAKRFKTAQAMFAKAAPVADDDPLPHYYLGKIALETGTAREVEYAIAHFQAAARANPRFAVTYRELGLAYYRRRNKRQGIAAFEQYLKLKPRADDAARVRTMIRELQRY